MKNYDTIIQENEDKKLYEYLDQGLECIDCKYYDECDFEKDSICKLEDNGFEMLEDMKQQNNGVEE